MMMGYYITQLPYSIKKGNPFRIDENGVLVSKIPYLEKWDYHATSISSYGIDHLYDYSEKGKQIVSSQLKWIEENIQKDGSIKHFFVLPHYDNFRAPWVGGLAQGLTISFLSRYYEIHGEDKYLDLSKKVYEGLLKYCIEIDKKGYPWISEYPGIHSILNGMIYAMFGIYDLYRIGEFGPAKETFDYLVSTLIENIHKYTLPYGTYYDLKYPATRFYHQIHIEQAKALYDLTKKSEFYEAYGLWKINFNRRKVSYIRAKISIEKNGVLGSIKRYRLIRRWKSA